MNKISLFKYVIAAMLCLNSAFAMEADQNQHFLPVVSADSTLTKRAVKKVPNQDATEVKISIPKTDTAAKAQNSSLFKRAICKVAETLKAGANFVKNNPKTSLTITAAAIGTVAAYLYWNYIPVPLEDKGIKIFDEQYKQEAFISCAKEGSNAFKRCFNKELNKAEDFCTISFLSPSEECLQPYAEVAKNKCETPEFEQCMEEKQYAAKKTCRFNPDLGKCLNQITEKNEFSTECENKIFKDETPTRATTQFLCIDPKQNKCLSAQDLCTYITAKQNSIPSICNGSTDKGPYGFSFNQLEKLKNGYCSTVLKNEKAQAGANEAFQKAANLCKQGNNAEQTIKRFYIKESCEKSARLLKDIENPISDLSGRSINDRNEAKNHINMYREAEGCDYIEKCFPDLTNNK